MFSQAAPLDAANKPVSWKACRSGWMPQQSRWIVNRGGYIIINYYILLYIIIYYYILAITKLTLAYICHSYCTSSSMPVASLAARDRRKRAIHRSRCARTEREFQNWQNLL